MIKCEKGIVAVKGNLLEIKTDLSVIINSLRENFSTAMSQDEADEHIRDAIDKGFMTEDDIMEKIKKSTNELPSELKELINAVFSPLFAGGDSDEN